MSIAIDKAGRIVVPKAMRERFGLHPGTELEIEVFVVKEGVLVDHGPSVAAGIDVAELINRQRDERALDSGARSA